MGPGVQAEAAPRGPAGRSPQAAGGSRFAVAAACRFGAAVSQGDPMARVASRRVARTRPGGNGSLSGTRRPRPEAYTAPGRSGESMHEGPRADGGAAAAAAAAKRTPTLRDKFVVIYEARSRRRDAPGTFARPRRPSPAPRARAREQLAQAEVTPYCGAGKSGKRVRAGALPAANGRGGGGGGGGAGAASPAPDASVRGRGEEHGRSQNGDRL
ncbi:translation initiation factor IF-2 isoform X2 [Cricetulus griseus]|uniref:Translation initiation factor IF-2 isoform X2 n=1 Tax=Cricetulus griseus TaxID=10029 RepID=A0A9J7G1H4_CRIGR|nr:translation initiation factor IF-2 isoform X2 [Cricetulus griseus]